MTLEKVLKLIDKSKLSMTDMLKLQHFINLMIIGYSNDIIKEIIKENKECEK